MNENINELIRLALKEDLNDQGDITNAVTKVRQKYGNKFKIEVETRNLDEVREALSLDMMSEAVKIISKKVFVEASGNMSF
ncbi:nicotinate-nucleotide pyrophosphorylase [Campylobacter hyointestinalis subsp. hyointestinalis]|uniref:Nicotinate-nucleotide pyrophosphorylase n=1 Tax=Campylobacter hyointestinalis subsp. hyointestinalis TaxID=91352 RepID=A0A9W5EZ80_CAMHY|nr:hypothetical protein [Campylobacter hyointestinalis]CUU75123.1 nicotinate-nucleotide pyrophosphorylase [Campylobacter hyointestinalis subsp. hyointestinalis]CUU75180.1 nicotinate-nucleotide pyrophosphorylase [Campylobacter hyointestinalis subsp. hyointestinalis]CUU76797.1 nicotinate-nucleotide pyrophosphorylase [Campylobacter hyointestinalis subsp. hyointestinalis]